MQISHKITYAGFLLAISAINVPILADASPISCDSAVEFRLSRLTEVMKQQEITSLEESPVDNKLARGWANGNRGNWVNGRRGGFADRHGGGGFVNRNWRDGGRFYNNRHGGGFFNR